MKKFILAVAGVGVLMGSGMASALDLGGGTNEVIMSDCSLLANDVNLILSNNVIGTLICNGTTNFAAISLCHTAGQTKSRSAVVTTDADGNTTCVISDTEDCVEGVEGASFPSATTRLGTVANQFGGDCDVATTSGYATTMAAATE